MANWENLIQEVSDVIKPNNSQAITGQVLQNSLINIIEKLGEGATFRGLANEVTNPADKHFDGPSFYIFKNSRDSSVTLANFSRVLIDAYAISILISEDGTTWESIEFAKISNSTVANSNVLNSNILNLWAGLNDQLSVKKDGTNKDIIEIGTGSIIVKDVAYDYVDAILIDPRRRKISIGTQTGGEALYIGTDKVTIGQINSYNSNNPFISVGTAGFKLAFGTLGSAEITTNSIRTYIGTDPNTSNIKIGGTFSSYGNVVINSSSSLDIGADAVVQIRSGVAIGTGVAPSQFENDGTVYLGPSAKIGTGIAMYVQMDSLIIKDLINGKTAQFHLS